MIDCITPGDDGTERRLEVELGRLGERVEHRTADIQRLTEENTRLRGENTRLRDEACRAEQESVRLRERNRTARRALEET